MKGTNSQFFLNMVGAMDRRRPHAWWILPLLLLLMLAAVVQAAAVVQPQFNYTVNNGTVIITGYSGPGGAVTIPSTIGCFPVASIGYQAFYHRTNLTDVTIPNSVTSIGGFAFYWRTSLTNVPIPDRVVSIGGFAFAGPRFAQLSPGLTRAAPVQAGAPKSIILLVSHHED